MVERRARVADWREFKSRIIGGGGDNRIGERFVAVAFNWAKVNSPTIWHSSKEWEQRFSRNAVIFILLEINSTPPLKNFEFSLEKKLVDSIPRSGDFFEYKFHISSIFELLNRGSIEIGSIYIYIYL